MTFAQWYSYMNTYVTAVMIVGGRLTPGYLLGHVNVMGQVHEQLQIKQDVAVTAAFMVRVESVERFVFILRALCDCRHMID